MRRGASNGPPIFRNVDLRTGDLATNWIDSLQAAWPGILVGSLKCSFIFLTCWLFGWLPGAFRRHRRSHLSARSPLCNLAEVFGSSREVQFNSSDERSALLPSETGVGWVHLSALQGNQESFLPPRRQNYCPRFEQILPNEVLLYLFLIEDDLFQKLSLC